eukprot:PRCOL_00005619-RA
MAKGNPANAGSNAGGSKMSKEDEAFLKWMTRPVERPQHTAEQRAEHAERAKEYSRRMMREEKRRSKQLAAMALPEGLRAAAEKPDLTPAPLHRHMAEHTHAVPGFSAAVRKAGAKAEGGDSDNPLAGIVG